MNRVAVYSLLQNEYSEHFGFTEEEVIQTLKRSNLANNLNEVREWYNDYKVGNTVVYNPSSIINYCKSGGRLASYEIDSSDRELIRNILVNSSPAVKDDLCNLIKGETIDKAVHEITVLGDLKRGDTAIWSLLFSSGYLKAKEQYFDDALVKCKLEIPNNEVRRLFRQIVEEWLSIRHDTEWYQNFLNNLLTGRIDLFEADLTHIMEETISSHDTNPEEFYHGLFTGLTASLYRNKNYELISNWESGYGRSDYLIFSKSPNLLSVLIEIKTVDTTDVTNPTTIANMLNSECQKGLEHIYSNKYATDAIKHGATKILKVSIAFSGKRFVILHKLWR